MAQWEALSSERHAGLYWQGFCNYHFAAERALVPMVAAELPRALGELPIAFTHEQGRPLLVAVLGVRPGHNAFVSPGGEWRARYVPAYLRTPPFTLAQPSSGQYVVAVDGQSRFLSSTAEHGQPLFDADGQPEPGLQRVLDFMGRLARQRAATDAACQALWEAELLEPWSLAVPSGSDEGGQALDGLYRVSDAGIKRLAASRLVPLRDSGALSVAYAQLLGQEAMRCLLQPDQPRVGQGAGQGSAVDATTTLDEMAALFQEDEMGLDFDQ